MDLFEARQIGEIYQVLEFPSMPAHAELSSIGCHRRGTMRA